MISLFCEQSNKVINHSFISSQPEKDMTSRLIRIVEAPYKDILVKEAHDVIKHGPYITSAFAALNHESVNIDLALRRIKFL